MTDLHCFLPWHTMNYRIACHEGSVPPLSHNVTAQLCRETVHGKANMLNTLISEWFNTVLPPLSELDRASQHLGQLPAERPDELLCTESEILNFLTAINISKASGPDNIPGRMLKSTAISIAPSITKIFNQSKTTGTFPHAWKQSNVVPIPKSIY